MTEAEIKQKKTTGLQLKATTTARKWQKKKEESENKQEEECPLSIFLANKQSRKKIWKQKTKKQSSQDLLAAVV